MAKTRKSPSSAKGAGAAKSTVSGPRRGPRGTNGDGADPAVAKMQNTQALAAAFPFNRNKPGEFGEASRKPQPGATAEPPDASVTASTLTEQTESPKTGAPAESGLNPTNAPLDRVRVDSGGQGLTTNFGQPIADALGLELPRPMPRVIEPPAPEVRRSPALSLTARPGDGSIRGRRIALLVAPGVDGDSVATTQKALTDAEAVVRLVGPKLAAIETADGDMVEPDGTLETMPSVLFDAVVVPDGAKAAATLAGLGQAREFLRDQYRHCKPMLLVGAGREVATAAGVPADDRADWAIAREVRPFIGAVGKHRNWDRATDPPRV